MAHDHWFLRASHGQAGRGTRPTGYEHHVLTKHVHAISLEATVRFASYGQQHYEVSAQGGVKVPHSTYESFSGHFRIDAELHDGAWHGSVEPVVPDDQDGEPPHPSVGPTTFTVPVPQDVDVMPSIVARFVPVWLPREEGELATYFAVPEDGYPSWQPPGRGSFFPVGGTGAELGLRTIVGRGEQQLRGATEPAWCYEHHQGGEVVASTWIDKRDRPVAYEQAGLLLILAREADARAALMYG